jgi:hypothetical protein
MDLRPAAWLAAHPDRGKKGTATLLYRSHDAEHNNAVAQRYLEAKPAAPGTRPLWSQDS